MTASTINPLERIDFHPIAQIFPMLEKSALDELLNDIREHGLREPIWLHPDGRILDGRNRYLACCQTGVEPRFQTYSGDDPVAFSISLNLHRRHLNESQRAMVAAKLANMKAGDNQHTKEVGQICPTSNADAGKMLSVSERSVKTARNVRDHGTPDLVNAVEFGSISVSAAADVATLPSEDQEKIVAQGEEAILQAARDIRARKAQQNAEARTKLRAEAMQMEPPSGKYRTIIVDPPWPMQKIQREVRPNQVGFDYPTMSEEELEKLNIPELAHDQCHLFLWTTQRFLPMALKLMEAWGFPYIFQMVWHKPGGFQPVGLPQFNCEFILFGRKGGQGFLETKAFPACFEAPRREHSRKPDEFYDLIRRVSPSPRIDLFSREHRDGFEGWGVEANTFGGASC